jgi:Ca2+/Na+ antiporter
MKNKIYHIVGTVLNSNRKIVERQYRHHLHTYTWLLTFLAWYRHFNKSGGVSLGLLLKLLIYLYVYFWIITTEEKNTNERPINLEPTTKKYEAHQTSTGMYNTNKLVWLWVSECVLFNAKLVIYRLCHVKN